MLITSKLGASPLSLMRRRCKSGVALSQQCKAETARLEGRQGLSGEGNERRRFVESSVCRGANRRLDGCVYISAGVLAQDPIGVDARCWEASQRMTETLDVLDIQSALEHLPTMAVKASRFDDGSSLLSRVIV